MASSLKLSSSLTSLISKRQRPGVIPRDFTPVFGKTLEELRRNMQGVDKFIVDLFPPWLVIVTGALVSVDRPQSMKRLYDFATTIQLEPDRYVGDEDAAILKDKTLRIATVREAALKSVALLGIPRVINNLATLHDAAAPDVLKELREFEAARRPWSGQHELRARGTELFDAIYTPHTRKLLAKLSSYHPDFPDVIVQHAYGGVLSNPYPSRNDDQNSGPPLLSRTLTSALAVACLRAEANGPQLTSHVYGLLKASKEREADLTPVENFLSSGKGARYVIDTVDEVLNLFPSADGSP